MKRYYAILGCAALASIFSSCSGVDDAISDLSGIYAAPTDLTITSATIADKTKDGSLRTYTIDFNTSEGKTITLALVSSQYYLATNGYTYAAAGSAKNGNFTDGSTIDGKAITSGTFALTQDGEDYTISRCTLFAEDGSAYRMQGSATMTFEVDDPTSLTSIKLIQNMDGTTTQSQNNGDGTVTITLTTGGYTQTQNASTYMLEYAGDGFDFQVQFYTEDGKLHPGTYSPGTGYVVGTKNEWEAYGAFSGTSWGVIANGTKTLTYITSGDIVVSKSGSIYTILIDQGKGGVYAQYKGAISELDPDGDSAGNTTTLTSIASLTNWASFGWGVNFIDIQFGTDNVTGTYDAAAQTNVYAGTGKLLQIELYSADGTLARGEYEIAASIAEGKAQAGCDNAYAPGTPSGCYICDVADGVVGTATYISAGTITVEGEGDSTTVTIVAGDDTYVFTGNLGL